MTQLGGNKVDAEMLRRVQKLVEAEDKLQEQKDEVKKLKADLKSDGYDSKCVNKVVKEMRAGPGYQADQLELEAVLRTYREGVGLPVELEDAQKRAKEAADALPDVDDEEGESGHKRRRRDSGETLQ